MSSSNYAYSAFANYSTSASSSSSAFSLPNIEVDSNEHASLLVSSGLPIAGSSRAIARIMDRSSPSLEAQPESKLHNRKHGRAGNVLHKLEVRNQSGLTTTQLMLVNEDLKPVEKERQQWGAWNFVAFWIADSFNINTWMISSSMIISGLSWWQSWICVWVGYFLAAAFVCLTGRVGAVYHIGFPVTSRASFGIFGALWPVFNRAAMACIWYGVQAWIGGQCVYLIIRAMWNSFKDVPNTMESSGTETNLWVSFFIFWLLSLPALWFPVHKIRHLFTVKSYVVPVAAFAFFGWSIKRAGGIGPIVHQPNKIHGSELAWAIVQGIMSSIANFAALICNNPDFSRFAIKPRDAIWSQLITIPCGFAFTSFIGIIVSSSSALQNPDKEPIWNPLDLLGLILDEGGAGNRTGVWFIAVAFALAQLGTNIAANSVSAGTDLTALAPRWINIRRGGYICALVGLVMCPWNLLSSSNKFTLYLSSYSVFMSSVAGVLICDYYWVRRGYLDVKQLYSGKKSGVYWYQYGFHWRAYAAYICGILINIVGFVGAVSEDITLVPIGATYIYRLNFFTGFSVSAIVYYSLCRWVGDFHGLKSSGWWEVHDSFEGELILRDDENDRLDHSRSTDTGPEARYSDDDKKNEKGEKTERPLETV